MLGTKSRGGEERLMTGATGDKRHEYRGWWRQGLRLARSRTGKTGPPPDANELADQEDIGTKIRRFLGFRLIRATAPLRTIIRSGEPIPARAVLKSAKITEKYFYHQGISLNDSYEERQRPSGEIKLVLPYDGDQYFTRQANDDVTLARRHGADRDDALVGFLALSGYENTDLGSVLNLDENHGSYPIEMRLPAAQGSNETDPLLADKSSCVATIGYSPRDALRRAFPVHLEIKVDDPDNSDIPWPPPNSGDGLDSNIMRQVDFLPGLSLTVRVSLALPRKLANGAHATVKEVFIGWPTRTSLSSLELEVADSPHAFWYNPERADGGGLEWRGIPMSAAPDPGGGDLNYFRSPSMNLFIYKPGDLYYQETLSGQVEVAVNRLMSSTDARLFDATGRLCRRPACELESVISTTFSLTLDDAFTKRLRTPYQQMHFDEVILTSARVDDILTALRTRGFTVAKLPDLSSQPNGKMPSCWLTAERTLGPDKLTMLIYAAGKRYRTRRQRSVTGGIDYQTTIESGDLQLYVYGFLQGDSKTVVREMNALRRALRERFARLPARR
jgi:hypothetical protein